MICNNTSKGVLNTLQFVLIETGQTSDPGDLHSLMHNYTRSIPHWVIMSVSEQSLSIAINHLEVDSNSVVNTLPVGHLIPLPRSSVRHRGHGGRVVTLSPPTSEAGVRSPSWPYVGKLIVACRWLAVYSTEP